MRLQFRNSKYIKLLFPEEQNVVILRMQFKFKVKLYNCWENNFMHEGLHYCW